LRRPVDYHLLSSTLSFYLFFSILEDWRYSQNKEINHAYFEILHKDTQVSTLFFFLLLVLSAKRLSSTYMSKSRVLYLEDVANSQDYNAAAQAEFLKVNNKKEDKFFKLALQELNWPNCFFVSKFDPKI